MFNVVSQESSRIRYFKQNQKRFSLSPLIFLILKLLNSFRAGWASSESDPNLLYGSNPLLPSIVPWNPYWLNLPGVYNDYLLTSLVPDGLGGMATIFYDLVDGHAIDQYNSPLHYITLPGAHHIIFSPETNHWINKATKRIVSGLSSPSPPQNPPKG